MNSCSPSPSSSQGILAHLLAGAIDLGHLVKVASTIFLHFVAILCPIKISIVWDNLRYANPIFYSLIFIYLFGDENMCVHMCPLCVWVPSCTCGDQRTTFESWFSPSTWVVGTELSSSGLYSKCFYLLGHLTILLNTLLPTNFSIRWFGGGCNNFILLSWKMFFCLCYSFYIFNQGSAGIKVFIFSPVSFYIHLFDVSMDSWIVTLPVEFILHCRCFHPNTMVLTEMLMFWTSRVSWNSTLGSILNCSLSSVPSGVQWGVTGVLLCMIDL